ncbi:MAG: formylglycine-generating enzyme family protein [Pseudomonadota bacterium]
MSQDNVGAEKPLKKKLVNKIGMEFILLPGGEFVMGTDDLTDDPSDLEAVEKKVSELSGQPGFSAYDFSPRHVARIKPFYLGRAPVTQAQWTRLMGNNKATYKEGWDLPMESVNWYDALKFIEKINELMGTDAHRLPTEAEWEYGCRAGSPGDFCFEGRASRLDNYAWFTHNARFHPRAVAQKKPNKFGLFDMHGLVWEWTSSQERLYPYRADDGREEPSGPNPRVVRGGSFMSDPYFCRCGFRDWHLPTHRDHDLGFRLAVS